MPFATIPDSGKLNPPVARYIVQLDGRMRQIGVTLEFWEEGGIRVPLGGHYS
jgi:hypothetical protein